jgi:hypothetical protein
MGPGKEERAMTFNAPTIFFLTTIRRHQHIMCSLISDAFLRHTKPVRSIRADLSKKKNRADKNGGRKKVHDLMRMKFSFCPQKNLIRLCDEVSCQLVKIYGMLIFQLISFIWSMALCLKFSLHLLVVNVHNIVKNSLIS